MRKCGNLQEAWCSCEENADRCGGRFSVGKQTAEHANRARLVENIDGMTATKRSKADGLRSSGLAGPRLCHAGVIGLWGEPDQSDCSRSQQCGFISPLPSVRGQPSLHFVCFLPGNLPWLYVSSVIPFLILTLPHSSLFSSFALLLHYFHWRFSCQLTSLVLWIFAL